MHPDKSAEPDGMSPGFYQKYWNVVGIDVIKLVTNFFETSVFEEGCTDINIVLVPKKKCPDAMTDLRPISVCHVVYKIASKVIETGYKR